MRWWLTIVIIILVVIALVHFFPGSDSVARPSQPEQSDVVRVERPRADELVKSPFLVKGQARGYWFFEASFLIELVDETGLVLGQGLAVADGDWQTTNFVPFTATINFDSLTTNRGVLVLHKDNPSGLAEYNDEVDWPVRFR